MRKLFALLALVALIAFGGAPSALAGSYDRVAQEDTAEEDDDGMDYGWIGLLGLAGLAGLLGRNRKDRDDVTVRSTPGTRSDRVE